MPIPELTAALEQIEGVRFAVMDGAHFDDLQGRLNAAGLSFEPLYVDDGKRNLQADGPHLVPLTDHGAIKRVVDLARGKPAVVWWVWPDEGGETQANLVRHLRSVNMVEIPVDRYDAPQESDAESGDANLRERRHNEGMGQPARYELVVFRHADPNVLAMILPLLDAAQVSRLFGRAVGIVLDAPDHGGLRTFVRPAQLPDTPKGWLWIRPEQYEGLRDARMAESRLRRLKYLRKHLPQPLAGKDDNELAKLVLQSEISGKQLGLSSEQAYARWAYLLLMTDGRAASTPEAIAFIKSGADPDARVKALITHTANALRSGAFT